MIALMVWQNLEANHIDAFYDIESISAGQFDLIIMNQIAARPYFMPLLTPGTLERCRQPGDWLSREINHAIHFSAICCCCIPRISILTTSIVFCRTRLPPN